MFSVLTRERIFIKTHNIEFVVVVEPENALFAGVCVHFSSRKFYRLDSEGVKRESILISSFFQEKVRVIVLLNRAERRQRTFHEKKAFRETTRPTSVPSATTFSGVYVCVEVGRGEWCVCVCVCVYVCVCVCVCV